MTTTWLCGDLAVAVAEALFQAWDTRTAFVSSEGARIGQHVRETGAGLMLTGGRSSYGPGGYYKSPLEPILPVSMELRQEHRKLALAIVVALDRSGSMAVPIGGGRTKMDLANLGTVQVLDPGRLRESGDHNRPRIIKTNSLPIVPMSIEDAAQRLGDSKNEFIVFRDMDSDKISVIYKRRDNNLGLIAPEV